MYDCLSGGGGNGRVALSDNDNEELLPECGKVANFLSGDRSVTNSNKKNIICLKIIIYVKKKLV